MSEPSPPSSASAIVGRASTSLASLRGKRKAPTEFFSHVSPPPLPFPADADHSGSEDDGGRTQKKARREKGKKPLAKKVAVWKDIRTWKEGEQGIGRFPVEILDQIISVDSGLELRDHLALAGTCRYFRTCYRDVVFQILFKSQPAFRSIHCSLPTISVKSDGVVCSGYWDTSIGGTIQPVHGPLNRSFNEARRIFSSGRSLVGAGGWTGWGVTRIEYDTNLEKASSQREDLERALTQYWQDQSVKLLTEDPGRWSRVPGRSILVQVPLQAQQNFKKQSDLRVVHGLDPLPSDHRRYSELASSHTPFESSEYDPWPSGWRKKVVEVVLTPSVNKATAKTKYQVTNQELLGLKERVGLPGASRASKWYYEAAVVALSLRSHGGLEGHAEHLAKLKDRKEKAHATRVKNGTVVVKKPKPLTKLQIRWRKYGCF